MPGDTAAEIVTLVGERQAVGIETGGQLTEMSPAAGMVHRHVEQDRGFQPRQSGGVDPQRPTAGDIGGEEVRGGAIGCYLPGQGSGADQHQRDAKRARSRGGPHRGSNVMVVWASCRRGIVMPCCVSSMLSV